MTELWQEIWQTISRNKWRSLMTAFGVFWGLLMLILLVGLGNGISNGITDSIKALPTNSMFFGGGRTSISYRGFGRDRSITIDDKDLQLLTTQLGSRLRYLTPLNFAGTKNASVDEYSFDCSVVGTRPCYYNVVPTQMLYGRYLNDIDLHERRKVCVIGRQVYETLFPAGGDPCGQFIQVGGIYYTVVGVVKKLSAMIQVGHDIDQSLLLPLTTEQLAYKQSNTIHLCIVTLHDEYSISQWKERVIGIAREHHFVHPDDKNAFWDLDLAELVQNFSNLFLGINILLWIVGCGSLLAGLIGISNIMLVTVKERTQEIGIRRALGARPRTIVLQILAESLVLTSMAGLAGFLSGVWILRFVGFVVENSPSDSGFQLQNPQIAFSVAIAATLVIIAGGLLAGWMPARRALHIKAIEALREE